MPTKKNRGRVRVRGRQREWEIRKDKNEMGCKSAREGERGRGAKKENWQERDKGWGKSEGMEGRIRRER